MIRLAVGLNKLLIIYNSPISDYWKLSYSPQNCIDERTHLLASAIINTCSDFFVFFLPIPTVFSLPIPFRQQLMLFILFAAGLVVCASGVVRIWYIHAAYSSYDRTWFSYPLWISSVLNLYIGIVRLPQLSVVIPCQESVILTPITLDMHRTPSYEAILLHISSFSIRA